MPLHATLYQRRPDDWEAASAHLLGDSGLRWSSPVWVRVLDGSEPLVSIEFFGRDASALICLDTVWKGHVVLAVGNYTIFVHVSRQTAIQVRCDDDPPTNLFDGGSVVLVGGSTSLRAIRVDGQQAWHAPALGLDGVWVRNVDFGARRITGDAEWDPPGGMRSFTLDLDSGARLP